MTFEETLTESAKTYQAAMELAMQQELDRLIAAGLDMEDATVAVAVKYKRWEKNLEENIS